MRLLALDTSTEQMAIALCDGGHRIGQVAEGGAASSARLIPLLLAMLSERGLGVADLDAVAVGQGPGAFTGLRTAISVAQGLAFGANKPVVMVDSLALVAEDARRQAEAKGQCFDDQTIWVVMDARMDEIYAAAYRHAVGRWQVLSAPGLYPVDSLLAAWQSLPPQQVAGSALGVFADRLPLQGLCVWPEVQQRAQALLGLAEAAWLRGEQVSAEAAQPLYLRDKVAQTTAERAALKAAQAVAAGAVSC